MARTQEAQRYGVEAMGFQFSSGLNWRKLKLFRKVLLGKLMNEVVDKHSNQARNSLCGGALYHGSILGVYSLNR